MNNIMIRNGIYAKQPSKYTNKNYKQHLTSIICTCTRHRAIYHELFSQCRYEVPHFFRKKGLCLLTGFIKQFVVAISLLLPRNGLHLVTADWRLMQLITVRCCNISTASKQLLASGSSWLKVKAIDCVSDKVWWMLSFTDYKINHKNTVILFFSTARMTSWSASGGISTKELRQQFVSADDYMLQSHLKNVDWLTHGQRLERVSWLVIFINPLEYILSRVWPGPVFLQAYMTLTGDGFKNYDEYYVN